MQSYDFVMEQQINRNKTPLRCLLMGVLLLFCFQLTAQLFSLFLFRNSKGGLLNAGVLVWEGVQTTPVLFAVLGYLIVQWLLLLLIASIVLLAARALKRSFKLQESILKVMVLQSLAIYAGLLVVNIYQYPDTLIQVAVVSRWLEQGIAAPLYLACTVFAVVIALALWEITCCLSHLLTVHILPRRNVTGSLIAILLMVSGFVLAGWLTGNTDDAKASNVEQVLPQKPNIILIGLDSLRLDLVKNVEVRREYLPNLSRWLEDDDTAWFTNAWTPLARTYGAWHALLSGQYPKTSGVRYNLQYVSDEQKRNTIVPRLVEQGYYTIYGSDEKRFSNIDESYGFHETLGPPPGAADWILSYLEDSPLHNPLRSTPLSRYLLPYTHANRGSATVYDPNQFADEMERAIEGYDRRQPLLMALHLCLAHWPYSWAYSDNNQGEINQYMATLQEVDQQFGRIMAALVRHGLTDNALVLVFSDHGEAFPKEAFDAPDLRDGLRQFFLSRVDRVLGHGTDLLTTAQSRVLLAIQDNRNQTDRISPASYPATAALVDVAPTVAQAAGVESYVADGMPLGVVATNMDCRRAVYMETGFNPLGATLNSIDVDKLVAAGISAYEVGENGQLRIKKEYHEDIVAAKQIGATDGHVIVVGRHGILSQDRPQRRYQHYVLPESDANCIGPGLSPEYLEAQLDYFYQSSH